MILITGAGGKTGKAVVSAVAARGAEVRTLVRHAGQQTTAERLGATQTVVGDLLRLDDLRRACQGIEAIYHICPNVHPHEVLIAQLLLKAARECGTRSVVFHSVLHPQTREMPHHWRKLQVEELLFQSALQYTILQPAAYMQNILAGWESIADLGVMRVPYSLETRLGLVDLRDVAEVAARVLIEPDHGFATYELAGGEILTPVEIAAKISDAMGRPVRAEQVDRREWATAARSTGLKRDQVTTLLQMFGYYERYGFCGNPRVLSMLLGRPPTSFKRFLETLPADRAAAD